MVPVMILTRNDVSLLIRTLGSQKLETLLSKSRKD